MDDIEQENKKRVARLNSYKSENEDKRSKINKDNNREEGGKK